MSCMFALFAFFAFTVLVLICILPCNFLASSSVKKPAKRKEQLFLLFTVQYGIIAKKQNNFLLNK